MYLLVDRVVQMLYFLCCMKSFQLYFSNVFSPVTNDHDEFNVYSATFNTDIGYILYKIANNATKTKSREKNEQEKLDLINSAKPATTTTLIVEVRRKRSNDLTHSVFAIDSILVSSTFLFQRL